MIDLLSNRVAVKTLEKMSASQWEAFGQFLECPIHNTDSHSKTLFQYLYKNYLTTGFTNPPIALEQATQIPASQWNKVFSHLFYLLNQFLEWEERDQHPNEQFRYLIPAYQKLGVEEAILDKEFRKAQKWMRKPPQSTENLQLEYWVAHCRGLNKIYDDRRKIPSHYVENQQLLDRYYITTRLKYLCATRNYEHMFNQPCQPLGVTEVLSLFQVQAENLPAMAHAYRMALLLLDETQFPDAQFLQLRQFLQDAQAEIPHDDLRDLWGYALNFCIRQLSLDRQTYTAITGELYKILLENDILLDNGKLPTFHFSNILKLRLEVGDLEWTQQFANEYSTRLTNDFGGSMPIYAQALLQLYQGNYPIASSHFKTLLAFNLDDIFWNLEFRSLLWQSYFENWEKLGVAEQDEMENLYDSFRIFVSRNDKIPATTRNNYQNFIRIFNRLRIIAAQKPTSITSLDHLLQEIDQEPHLANRNWLKAQIKKISPRQ